MLLVLLVLQVLEVQVLQVLQVLEVQVLQVLAVWQLHTWQRCQQVRCRAAAPLRHEPQTTATFPHP